jgi:hypothetical protein
VTGRLCSSVAGSPQKAPPLFSSGAWSHPLIAELSQTEAVVSSLVLGYMFLGGKIERVARGK